MQSYGDGIQNPRARQRALVIAAGPDEPDLSELRELLRTAGVAVAGELSQRRARPDPDRYLGKGKLAELRRAIAESDANLVACDDELLPRQERNLEQEVGLPVIDRTAIILDIFADHAASAEGKLQVELAQLEYNLARMRGLWTHLERLGGGIGTRGPGETQIETDRRLARDRIAALKRKLEQTRATRSTMRRERRRELSFRHPDAVQVSAATGDGLDDLGTAIEARFLSSLRAMDLLVPYEEGGSLSELHEVAGDVERSDTAAGVRVRARVPAGLGQRVERFEGNRAAERKGRDPAG